MGDEIERKWLVSKIPQNLFNFPFSDIDQKYFDVSNPEIDEARVRKKRDRYFLAIKKGSGVKRDETEIEVPLNTYFGICSLPLNGVKKRRYDIPDRKFTIELDIYKGNLEGLVIAEVEFENLEASQSYNPLEWFNQEVTNDERYKNKNLAVNGIPK